MEIKNRKQTSGAVNLYLKALYFLDLLYYFMCMSVGGLCATMLVPGIKPGPERTTNALKHWAITLAFQGTIS